MHPRAQELITQLDLQPHPEGGFYNECFRSEVRVTGPGGERDGLTAIYFLLPKGYHSRWHQVLADEMWVHVEGDGLELLDLDLEDEQLTQVVIGPLTESRQPMHAIAAGRWQAARPLGEYALVTCLVAPGFEFADFSLLSDRPLEAKTLKARFPELADLL